MHVDWVNQNALDMHVGNAIIYACGDESGVISNSVTTVEMWSHCAQTVGMLQ
jgi:hypothetical protein